MEVQPGLETSFLSYLPTAGLRLCGPCPSLPGLGAALDSDSTPAFEAKHVGLR